MRTNRTAGVPLLLSSVPGTRRCRRPSPGDVQRNEDHAAELPAFRYSQFDICGGGRNSAILFLRNEPKETPLATPKTPIAPKKRTQTNPKRTQ